MPELDGFQTSLKIRAYLTERNLQQPWIIACSGHTEQEYIEKAWRSQIDEVIKKPITVEAAKEIMN